MDALLLAHAAEKNDLVLEVLHLDRGVADEHEGGMCTSVDKRPSSHAGQRAAHASQQKRLACKALPD
jgi:hypothetical protein